MFFLLYKRDDAVFDNFPKISDHFPKISEDFSKLFRRHDERFRTFSEHFRTFYEDCRRLPKIAECNRRCFDHTPTNLSVVDELLMSLRKWIDIQWCVISRTICEIHCIASYPSVLPFGQVNSSSWFKWNRLHCKDLTSCFPFSRRRVF